MKNLPTLNYAQSRDRRTLADENGFLSLISGSMVFVPIVTGLMAVIFGVASLCETPRRYRAAALVGITLGCINLVAWLGACLWPALLGLD
jgi:hypothetical protein